MEGQGTDVGFGVGGDVGGEGVGPTPFQTSTRGIKEIRFITILHACMNVSASRAIARYAITSSGFPGGCL